MHRSALRPYAGRSRPSCGHAASGIVRCRETPYLLVMLQVRQHLVVFVHGLDTLLSSCFLACSEHYSLHHDIWSATAASAAQLNLTAKAVPVTEACCACNVQVQWLPAVGPAGENLVRAPEEPRLAAWWRGPCVLGAIDAFAPPARNVARPLRLPVAEVGKGARGGTAVSGKLEAGALRVCRVPHD